jgi:hypothetical protein
MHHRAVQQQQQMQQGWAVVASSPGVAWVEPCYPSGSQQQEPSQQMVVAEGTIQQQ